MVWAGVLQHPLHLAVAYALPFPIGWDMENEALSAGLRSFLPVAVASCGYVPVALELHGRGSQSHARLAPGGDMGIHYGEAL